MVQDLGTLATVARIQECAYECVVDGARMYVRVPSADSYHNNSSQGVG